MTLSAAVLAIGLTLLAGQPSEPSKPRWEGQGVPRPGSFLDPGIPSQSVPDVLAKVGVDQKLDAQVPLDMPFVDETGRAVTLGDYFKTRPVLLTLVYFECPMLCTQVLNGVVGSLKTLNFTAGKEFDILTVSFNPKETPALATAKKASYLARYGRPEAETGWHFLTGQQPAIDALAGAVGFRYYYDKATDQYVHASAIMLLTPQGRISRYFYGIEYPPRDVRLGLIDAASGHIGNIVDQMLLYCYHYDPHSGKYSMVVMNVLRLAGIVTVVLIVGFILVARRRDRTGRQAGAPGAVG
jgi:protein SCO1/2